MSSIRSKHIFFFLYTLFIIYGSLFPLSGWRIPRDSLLDSWHFAAGNHLSRSDLIANFLGYIPMGFLLCSVLSDRFRRFTLVLLTIIIGSSLSFSMEYCQLYLPDRTSSLFDFLLNVFGVLSGGVLYCYLKKEMSFGHAIKLWRAAWFHEGQATDIGVAVIVAWSATQLLPFIPTFDVGQLKNGLKPLFFVIRDISCFNWNSFFVYMLNICSLGMVLLLIAKRRVCISLWLGLFCGTVLLTKIMIIGRQLSLEALFGLLGGILLVTLLQPLSKKTCILFGAICVFTAFAIGELRPEMTQSAAFYNFNIVPFANHFGGESISGADSIIAGLWPFATLGFFALNHSLISDRQIPLILTGLALAGIVFFMEYAQSFIVGRYPDITTVALAIIGWWIPFVIVRLD